MELVDTGRRGGVRGLEIETDNEGVRDRNKGRERGLQEGGDRKRKRERKTSSIINFEQKAVHPSPFTQIHSSYQQSNPSPWFSQSWNRDEYHN